MGPQAAPGSRGGGCAQRQRARPFAGALLLGSATRRPKSEGSESPGPGSGTKAEAGSLGVGPRWARGQQLGGKDAEYRLPKGSRPHCVDVPGHFHISSEPLTIPSADACPVCYRLREAREIRHRSWPPRTQRGGSEPASLSGGLETSRPWAPRGEESTQARGRGRDRPELCLTLVPIRLYRECESPGDRAAGQVCIQQVQSGA